mmetsp:Transcript_79559/g.221364  ORF Transcript_79559/g.221364 Transcript_79559/m.221364 type:complete len:251 (+) Transcript_79559:233-985(+)
MLSARTALRLSKLGVLAACAYCAQLLMTNAFAMVQRGAALQRRARRSDAHEASLDETLAAAFAWEKDKRVANGELSSRATDALAVAPAEARPSALLAPDRVLEHVLRSLALLPVGDAIRQAFVFTWFEEDDLSPSSRTRRQDWKRSSICPLERPAFSQMIYEDYAFLLDRECTQTRYLAPPKWSDDDRRVSFLVALDDAWSAGSRRPGPALVVTLQRPAHGTHRDCWLLREVALLPDPADAEASAAAGIV